MINTTIRMENDGDFSDIVTNAPNPAIIEITINQDD